MVETATTVPSSESSRLSSPRGSPAGAFPDDAVPLSWCDAAPSQPPGPSSCRENPLRAAATSNRGSTAAAIISPAHARASKPESLISSMGTIAFEAITARRGFRPPYVSVETPPAYRLAGSTLLFPDEPDHPKSPCWCTMDRKKLNYDRPPGCRCDRFEKYAQRAEAGAAAEGRAGGK